METSGVARQLNEPQKQSLYRQRHQNRRQELKSKTNKRVGNHVEL